MIFQQILVSTLTLASVISERNQPQEGLNYDSIAKLIRTQPDFTAELQRSARTVGGTGCRLEHDRFTHEQLVQTLICGNALAKLFLERKVR